MYYDSREEAELIVIGRSNPNVSSLNVPEIKPFLALLPATDDDPVKLNKLA